ncbi:MAG: hypothetical protein WCO12_02570 [bacterium]
MSIKIFPKTYVLCTLFLFLITPFSQASAVTATYQQNTSSTADANSAGTNAAQNQADYDKAMADLKSSVPQSSSMQSTPTGALNYSSAFGGCIGKIAGKYIANYIGLGISSAVNAISTALGLASKTERTTSATVQAADLVIAVPITNKSGYLQNDALLNLQEDARRQSGSDNTAKNFLTPMAVCIANELVQAMTASTIQWINSGFKNPDGTSGPGFVSNPSKFFQGIADRETTGFFQALGGSFLCKPFSIQVRLALLNDYRGSYQGQAQCTLESIKNNLQNFGKGTNGGTGNYWNDWFQLTQQDNNNYMGSYFLARDQLSKNIAYNQDMNRLQITIDRGFLAMKKCPDGGSTCAEKDKITTTPGAQVEASLNRVLNLQGERINIANSFDDIISALVGQMLKMAVGGLQGGNK